MESVEFKPKKVTKKELRLQAARAKKQEKIYVFISEKVVSLMRRGLTKEEAEQVAVRMAKDRFQGW